MVLTAKTQKIIMEKINKAILRNHTCLDELFTLKREVENAQVLVRTK